MIVVGTAGHIDHGKSSIVKRLTGTDPDRLPEEIARGMTIDLGFAFFRTSAGDSVALVDVPGHERFVKNMIAGAGGIDIVMLVVAADDGWMPQTQEHFQIVSLLGISAGLIVINKIDLVEPDWLDLLENDIRARIRHSFLVDAPIFRVSSQSGAGFEQLAKHFDTLPDLVASRKDIRKARLFIDRAFVRAGMGRVATGTLRGGSFTVGQSVSVWPAQVTGKVRTLQSNKVDVTTALPGQRTAVSLSSVDKEHLVRGGTISDRLDLAYFTHHPVLAVSVQLLNEAQVGLEDRRRILVIHGTTEIEAEVRIFDRDIIAPGEHGILFIRPDHPLYALVADRFIIRLPTPAVTLGGGVVLDHLETFPRRRDLASLAYLHRRASGRLEDILLSELTKRCFVPEEELLRDADFSAGEVAALVAVLIERKDCGSFRQHLYHCENLRLVTADLKQKIESHLKEQPHLKGLTRDQIGPLVRYSPETVNLLTDYLESTGELTRTVDKYDLAGRGMSLKGVIKEAHDRIIAALREQPYAPPSLTSLAAGGKPSQEAIKYIIESGEGYKCGSEFLFLAPQWHEITNFIRTKLNTDHSLAVTDLRDRFGFTRKYAIPILEETDRRRLTRREGDLRVKGDRFESENPAL